MRFLEQGDRTMTEEQKLLAVVIAAGGRVEVTEEHLNEVALRRLMVRCGSGTDSTEFSAEPLAQHQYGYCAHCNSKVVSRERKFDGNDTCESGHVYPSRLSRMSEI